MCDIRFSMARLRSLLGGRGGSRGPASGQIDAPSPERVLRKPCQGLGPTYEVPHMLNIMVCEDDANDAKRLESVLATCQSLRDVDYQVESFRTVRQFLLNYDVAQCDILFLDVLMGDEDGKNGIDVARQVRKDNADIPIVFVTSSVDYAIDSYDVEAVHYIVKPVTQEAVDRALERCNRVIGERRHSIEVMTGRMSERVLVRDIIYAEALGHHVTIHLPRRTIETTTPLARIAEDGGRDLLRCHRSYVINMNHVKRAEGKSFLMADGSEVPVRTNGASDVMAAYHAHLFDSVREP